MDSIFNNVIVSVYKNTWDKQAYPKSLLWLLTTDRWAKQVMEYRAALPSYTDEQKSDHKKRLVAFTPSVLQDSRGGDHPFFHTGFMAFDIDGKGNPYSPATIRDSLADLPEVAYCGLSVSGTGVWGLVKIAHPSDHQRHFEALKADFAALGIELDKQTGDVARLRFWSYDPEAHINHQARTYTKLSSMPKLVRLAIPTHYEGSGKGLLEWAAAKLSEAIEGERYGTLQKVAYTLGGKVGSGTLNQTEVYNLLVNYATAWGNLKKDEKVITDCMRDGMAKPF